MKQFTRDYVLNGITEADFQSWKHNPVTKLYLRWLRDYERLISETQIGMMRSASDAPDPYKLGMFNGRINAVAEAAAPQYESIVNFYPAEPDQQEAEAET